MWTMAAKPKIRCVHRPPLFLQHQGHSRTIVGYEKLRNGNLNLLVFDPGNGRSLLTSDKKPLPKGAAVLRPYRVSQFNLKRPQYQILQMDRPFSNGEMARGEGKLVRSHTPAAVLPAAAASSR